MLRRNGARPETVESVWREEGSLGWKGFEEQVGFEPGVKSEGVMDGESGESTVEMRWQV